MCCTESLVDGYTELGYWIQRGASAAKQLRAEARLRGFNDISKLKKSQFKNLLSKPQDLDQLRKRILLVTAKKLGIKTATKLKKTQLINEIDDKVLKLVEEKQSSFTGFTNQFTLEPSGNVTFARIIFDCCETKGTRKNSNANQSENHLESKYGKNRSQDW